MAARILANICSADLAASKEFYTEFIGLLIKYESDWYIQLSSPENPLIELGIILRDHELVPADFQNSPAGMYLTFVVKDVDQHFELAKRRGLPIVQESKDEFYGQRRFLTKDPNGCLVDICSPVK